MVRHSYRHPRGSTGLHQGQSLQIEGVFTSEMRKSLSSTITTEPCLSAQSSQPSLSLRIADLWTYCLPYQQPTGTRSRTRPNAATDPLRNAPRMGGTPNTIPNSTKRRQIPAPHPKRSHRVQLRRNHRTRDNPTRYRSHVPDTTHPRTSAR